MFNLNATKSACERKKVDSDSNLFSFVKSGKKEFLKKTCYLSVHKNFEHFQLTDNFNALLAKTTEVTFSMS